MADEARDQVPLLLLVAFLVRWRRLLVAVPLSVALVTAGISYLMPARYASSAVVRLPEGAGTGIVLGGEPGAVCLSILYSRWMCERVITRFDLGAAYGMQTAPFDAVMMTLLRRTTFTQNDTTKNLLLTVEDSNPRRAREMADYYIEQLDLHNQELQAQRARDEYRFFAARLAETAATLRQREDSLCQYQMETGVFDIGAQAQVTLQAAATLDAQRLKVYTRRELARQLYGALSPDAQYWRLYAVSLDSALQRLLRSSEPVEHQFVLTLDAIPRQQRAIVRLQREIAAYGELTGYLLQLREIGAAQRAA